MVPLTGETVDGKTYFKKRYCASLLMIEIEVPAVVIDDSVVEYFEVCWLVL